MELQYIRTDKNGTKIYHDWNCARCGGAGQSDNWKFTGLICYECGGTGKRKNPKIIREYTPEHRAKLDAAARIRQEKKIAEDNANFFKKYGFAQDGTGYVFTGDTYAVKDELKRNGAKFNNYLNWVAPHPIGDYPCVKVDAADVCRLERIYGLDWDKCRSFMELLKNT